MTDLLDLDFDAFSPAIQPPEGPEPADAATPLEEPSTPVEPSTEQVAPPVQPKAFDGEIDFDAIPPNPDYDLSKPAAAEKGSLLPELGKGVAGGAVETTGGMIKGAGATRQEDMYRRAQEEARAKALKDLGYDDMVIFDQLPPEEAAKVRQAMDEAGKSIAVPDVTKDPFFRTGDQITKWSESQFKAAQDYEDSWTRAISSGIGSTLPFVVAGSISTVGGGTAGAFSSTGEAVDRALAAGATPEQVMEAIRYGKLPGMTEQIPIEVMLSKIPTPGWGKAMNVVTKIAAQAFAEGGQEGVQQVMQNMVAKYIYKPDQDLTEGVLEAAAVGAVVGSVFGGAVVPFHGEGAKPANAPEVLPDPTQKDAAKPVDPPGVVRPAESTGTSTPGGLGAKPAPPADAGTPVPPAEVVPQTNKEEIKRKTKRDLDGETVTPTIVEPGAAAPDVTAVLGGGPTTPVETAAPVQPLPSTSVGDVEEEDDLTAEDLEDYFSPEAKAAAVARIQETKAKSAIVAAPNADIAAALTPAQPAAQGQASVPQVPQANIPAALPSAASPAAVTPQAGPVAPKTPIASPEPAMEQTAPVAPAVQSVTPRSRFDISRPAEPAVVPPATVTEPAATPTAAAVPAPAQTQAIVSSPSPAGAVPEIIRPAPAPVQRAPVQEPAMVAEKPKPSRAQAAGVGLRDTARAAIGKEAPAVDVHAAVDQAVIEAIASLDPGAAPGRAIKEHGESVTRRAREILAEKRGKAEAEEAAKTEEAIAKSKQQAEESAYAGKHKAKPKAVIEREETRATERAAEKELRQAEPAPWAAKWVEANKQRKAAKGRGKADVVRAEARTRMAEAQAERLAATSEAAPAPVKKPAEERSEKAKAALQPIVEAMDLETPMRDLDNPTRPTKKPFSAMKSMATDFIKQVEAAYKAAGVTAPQKLDKTHSPVENLYVFAKGVMEGRRGDMAPSDVYIGILTLKRGTPEAVDELYDMMGESASLKGGISTEQLAAPGITDETLERQEGVEAFDAPSQIENVTDYDLQGKVGKAPEHPAGVVPQKTMTATEALTDLGAAGKVSTGFGHLTGAFNIFRKMHVKKLKQLVGDVRVHVISQEEMQELYAQRGVSPGGYVYGSYTNYSDADRAAGRKPVVYIDDLTAAAQPELYANTLIHELTHAATSLAYRQNTNGTKDIVDRLFGSLKAQIAERRMAQGMTREEVNAEMKGIYGLTSPTEFLAEAFSNPQFQQMLTQLRVPPRIAQEIRALTQGRTTPTWWDAFVATVQNAVGMFHMGGASSDYFNATIAVHPSVMLSSKTQSFLAKRAAARISDKEHADNPLDLEPMLQKVANSANAQYLKDFWAPERIRTKTRFALSTTMGLAMQADRALGSPSNPLRRLIELFLKQASRRRKLIEPGEEMLGEMLRSHSPAEVREMTDVGYDMTEAQVDGRVPLNDPANKHISKKGELDRWRRAAHAKSAAEWAKLSPEQQATLSRMIDHYQDFENKISRQLVKDMLLDMTEKYANVTLPTGVSLDQAIDWVYNGHIDRKGEMLNDPKDPKSGVKKTSERNAFDDAMHAALGKHAQSLAGSQNMRKIKGVYLPMTRTGKYVISGVHEVKTPNGSVPLTKDKYNNQFVFHDKKALRAYQDSTDDQVQRIQSVWRDPATGERIDPKEPQAVQEYVVTVQNRVFEMDDKIKSLDRAAEEYRKMGYEVTKPQLRRDAFSTGNEILPRQLQRLLNSARQAQPDPGATGPSISQRGREAAIIDAYIRQLSGSRAQQRRLKRQNVKGYSRDLTLSFARHNRMMAGYLTNLEVGREMAAAEAELDKMKPEKLGYGKTETVNSLRVSDIRAEVAKRVNAVDTDGAASPIVNAVTGMVFLTHLWSPMYSVVNAYQPIATTLPELGKRLYNKKSIGNYRAFVELNRALGIMGAGKSAWAGFRDSVSIKNLAGIFTGKQDFSRVEKQIGRYDDKGAIYDRVKKYEPQIKPAGVTAHYGETMAQAIDALNEIGLGADAGIETEVEQVGMNAAQRALNRSQHSARAMPQVVEAQNRYITAIASVKIDLDMGVSPEQAVKNAVTLVEKTQGGYESENNPAMFSHPVGKIALQFKKYAVLYGNLFGQNLADSINRTLPPEDRKAARKATLTMLLTTGLVAGAAGMPGVELVKWVFLGFNFITGMSDDDWDDTVGWLQGMLAELIGATPAEVATHGLPRLVGISLENRMGADSLVTFGSPDSYSKVDVMAWLFSNMSGAAVGAGLDAATKVNQGKYMEALTKFMPKFMADAYKGYALGTEGDVTKTGRSKGEPYSIGDTVKQTVGLQPAEKERRWEPGGNRYKEQQDTKAKKRRSDTMGQWLNADKEDRDEIWKTVIQPYNVGKKSKDKITKSDLYKNLRRRKTEERKAAKEDDDG